MVTWSRGTFTRRLKSNPLGHPTDRRGLWRLPSWSAVFVNPIVFLIATVAAGIATLLYALRRIDTARNVVRLQERYGCDRAQAERLYLLARRDGFGSAYREVFGTSATTIEREPPAPG
jgi:hypothetical protein